MGEFTLDTSGAVEMRRDLLGNGVPAEPDRVSWSDLSPFEQGYIEALFASLAASRAPASPRRRTDAAQRVYDIFRSEGEQHSDLDPHFRCGRIGVRKPEGHAIALAVWQAGRDTGVGFSDLAPETLAAIRKDCAAAQGFLGQGNMFAGGMTREAGAEFFANRQRGECQRGPLFNFPPLTITLSDDGKVRTSTRAGA